MDVQVKQCEPMHLIGVRHVGPYMEIGKAFGQLSAYAGAHNLFGPGANLIGVYYDDPATTAPADLRSDACIAISGSHEPRDGTHLVELDAGRYACAIHRGHYRTLGDTYGAIMQWIKTQNLRMACSPCYEIYLNTPFDTKPEDLRTEVRVPLA